MSRNEHWLIEALNAVSEQRPRHATARHGFTNAYRDQLQQADGPDQKTEVCSTETATRAGSASPHHRLQSGLGSRQQRSHRERRAASLAPPLQPTPRIDCVDHDGGRHEPAQEEIAAGRGDQNESKHGATFQMFGNKNLKGLKVMPLQRVTARFGGCLPTL
ncbi:hypothetical protein [Cryobacterium sp. Hh7]|uniref:hypothetical protein n=1 Tax=Cryobacterium sp. Hh7 TaxID=1259159 RepID=UPI00141ACB6E